MRTVARSPLPFLVFLVAVGAGGGAVAQEWGRRTVVVPDASLPPAEVEKRLARYVHAEIGPPIAKLDAKLLKLLRKLVTASEAVERAYWDQVSPDGYTVSEALDRRADTAWRNLSTLMRIHFGPWDRLADNQPFLGRAEKPEGANLYPADASRREIEKWIADHPTDRDAFLSPYTVMRRSADRLVAVPYSKAFPEALSRAAAALREAADLTDCKGFAKFLRARADALLSDDYYASELAWMDTGNCRVDAAIGPYEFYEDRLMGFKTAFGSIVTVTDDAATAKLAKLGTYADELLAGLPLADPAMKDRFEAVRPTPITVADEVFAAGDARAGFQIRAYVLPNDEKVRVARGTKHVILRNVADERFKHLLLPIAAAVIPADRLSQVDFGSYFDILLMWQLAHGIAPKTVALANGHGVPPRLMLRQRAGVIEAARAEAVALLNAFALADKGVLPATRATTIPWTYLASLFEAVRTGVGETHGIAKLIVYNKLAEADAFRYDPATRRFLVNPDRIRAAVRELAGILLSIEIRGDYDAAGRLIVDYGLLPGEVRDKLSEIAALPVDILPHYVIRTLGE